MKHYNQHDFQQIPIQGLVAESVAAAPSTPANGRIYYDTVLNKLMARVNGAWVDISIQYTTGTAAQIATGTDTASQVWKAADLKTAIVSNSPVQSVAGRTGVVVLTKTDVGLANVDNTSDANKPVSTAQQTALNLKANLASPIFTGTVTVPTPVGSNEAANKGYVDNAISGIKGKSSVRMATTANVALTGLQTIDGVSGAAQDRVLVKNQTAPAENGIYEMQSGAWVRANDANVWAELQAAFVFVEEGTTLSDTGWLSTANAGGTLGTTAIPWVQFSSAGVVTASGGLVKVGNDISIATDGVTAAKMADASVDLATATVTGTLPVNKGGTGVTSINGLQTLLAIPYFYWNVAVPTLAAGTWTVAVTMPTLCELLSSEFYEISSVETVDLDVRVVGDNIEVRSAVAVASGTLNARFVMTNF